MLKKILFVALCVSTSQVVATPKLETGAVVCDSAGSIRQAYAVATTNPLSHIYSPRSHRMRDIGDGGEWLPHRELIRERVPFGIGTDNKIADPFVALWSVVRQKLTAAQALRQLTIGGAAVIGRQSELGSLAPGKFADLVVLSDNPLKIPVADIPKVRARLTMVGGRPVYRENPPKDA